MRKLIQDSKTLTRKKVGKLIARIAPLSIEEKKDFNAKLDRIIR